jgi:hypothetical protein
MMSVLSSSLAFKPRTSVFLVFFAIACGSAPVPPAAPPVRTDEPAPSPPPAIEAVEEPTPAPVAAPTSPVVPMTCADDNAEGICAPPSVFVKDVCGGFAKPDVALALFAKGSPWTRGYLRLNVDAWYTASRSAKVALKLDEEVIVMHHPNPSGGIIVNGGAPYDVMRLDGNCATLSGEEVTLKRPPAPKHPPVPWKQLDPRTREALLQDSVVSNAKDGWDDDCGHTPACVKAEGKLTVAILDYMARGGKVPLVTRR